MELLDQYLEAVKRHLPWDGQDDILAELRSNLESQAEDKEAELGRPMTKAEVERWLHELGSPLHMAARYKPQQYLIGPSLFPVYWYVLRMVLLWTLGIYAVVNAIKIAFSAPNMAKVSVALLHAPLVLLIAAAWITLIFAVLERAAKRNPEILTRLNMRISDWRPAGPFDAGATRKQTSKAKVIADVVFKVLFLTWLLLLPHYPQILWGPGAHYLMAQPYRFAPVAMQFYWWIVALNALQLVMTAVALMRGNWQETHAARKLVEKAFALLPLGWLLTASGHVYFLLKNAAPAKPEQVTKLAIANHSLYEAFWLVWIIVLVQFLWQAGQTALEAWRRRAASR